MLQMKKLRDLAPQWLKAACDHISTVHPLRGCNIIKHGWNQLYLDFALDKERQQRALAARNDREAEARAAAREDAIATNSIVAAQAAAMAMEGQGISAHAMAVGKQAGITAGAAAVAALTVVQNDERRGRYVGLSRDLEELCAVEREYHESELPKRTRLQHKGKARVSRKSSDAIRAEAKRQRLATPSDSDAECDDSIGGEPSFRQVTTLVRTACYALHACHCMCACALTSCVYLWRIHGR